MKHWRHYADSLGAHLKYARILQDAARTQENRMRPLLRYLRTLPRSTRVARARLQCLRAELGLPVDLWASPFSATSIREIREAMARRTAFQIEIHPSAFTMQDHRRHLDRWRKEKTHESQ